MEDQVDNQNTETESVQPTSQQAEQAAADTQDAIGQATQAAPAEAAAEPVAEKTPEELAAESRRAATLVEAVLFSTDAPLTAAKLGGVTKLPVKMVKQAIAALNEGYQNDGRSFRIEAIAGGYQMLSQPEYHDTIARLLNIRSESKLSQASLETLAVIAYRQPVLRADIEVIRGVACGEVLRTLMEKQLVKIVGRAEVLGRPMLYGTTKKFLEIFGLNSLEDLPRVEELRTGFQDKPKSAESPKAENEQAAKPEENAPAPAAPADAIPEPAAQTAELADGAAPEGISEALAPVEVPDPE